MDLKNDLKTIVKEKLDNNGLKYSSNDDLSNILFSYYNFVNKRIVPQPRIVYKSEEFTNKENELSDELKLSMNKITDKLQQGKDINYHLSEKINQTQHQDLLLNDWKIHHIHISEKPKSKKSLFKGGDDLAFAMVFDTDVYLIDIATHHPVENFARKELLKIVKDNWPKLLEPFKLSSKHNHDLSNTEILKRRKNRILTCVEIDGEFYLPPNLGLTTAGTSIYTTEQVIDVISTVSYLEKIILENKEKIRNHIDIEYPKLEGELEFKLILIDSDFVVQEIKTGSIVTSTPSLLE